MLQRRRDIAIRMALGARRESVIGLFLQQGVRVTVAGLVFGLLGGYALSRLLRGLLYGVTPGDIATYMTCRCCWRRPRYWPPGCPRGARCAPTPCRC